jgi:hypothetical protein
MSQLKPVMIHDSRVMGFYHSLLSSIVLNDQLETVRFDHLAGKLGPGSNMFLAKKIIPHFSVLYYLIMQFRKKATGFGNLSDIIRGFTSKKEMCQSFQFPACSFQNRLYHK